MRVLSVYLLGVGSDKDFEVATCLPFGLLCLDPIDFLLEDGVADQVAEKVVTRVLILFVAIHEISHEKGEVEDEDEQGSHADSEDLLGKVCLLEQGIFLDEFFRSQDKLRGVFREFKVFLQDVENSFEEVFMQERRLEVVL